MMKMRMTKQQQQEERKGSRNKGVFVVLCALVVALCAFTGSSEAQSIPLIAYPITFGETNRWYGIGDTSFGNAVKDFGTPGVTDNFIGMGGWRLNNPNTGFESVPLGVRSPTIMVDPTVHTLLGDPYLVNQPSGASTSVSMSISYPFDYEINYALFYYEIVPNNNLGRTIRLTTSSGYPTALDGWKFPGPARTRVFFSSNGNSFLENDDHWVIFHPPNKDYVSFGINSIYADAQYSGFTQSLTQRGDGSYVFSMVVDLDLTTVGEPVGILIPVAFFPQNSPGDAFQGTVNFLASEDSLVRSGALKFLSPDRVSRTINFDFQCRS